MAGTKKPKKLFEAKGGGSFNFGANKRASKPRKKTGIRRGRGPGGLMMDYGS